MSLRRTLTIACTAGAITVATVGVLPAAAEDTGSTTPTAEQPAGQASGPRAERRQARIDALAAELGVSHDDLVAAARAAHQSVVDQLGPVDRENPPDDAARAARRDAFEAALADELGITVEDLDAARLAVFEDRAQALVDSGRITEEQADEAVAHFQDGTLRDYLREQGLARLSDRLDQAVANGRLTQDQADEILAAAEAGTLREQIQSGEIDLPFEGRPHRPGRR